MKKQKIIYCSVPFLVLYICSIGIKSAYAQDQMVKKDGQTISAIIVEVLPDMIKYKKYENQSGPVYSIQKSEVSFIKYAYGSKDLFDKHNTQVSETPALAKDIPPANIVKSNDFTPGEKTGLEKKTNRFPRSILSYNPLHLIFGAATIQYEITSKKGKIGFEIPLSVAIDGTGFSSGFTFKWYPAGQGVVRPFLGPSMEAGYSSKINTADGKVDGTLLEFYPYAGVAFTFGRHFTIGLGTKVGIGYYSGTTEDPENYNYFNSDGQSIQDVSGTYLAYRINLSLGVRF